MSLTPADITRRRNAKALNEQTKLTANALNTAALGMLGAAVIVPAVNEKVDLSPMTAVWTLASIALHVWARVQFRFYKSED